VAHGSVALVRLVDHPLGFALVLAGLALLVLILVSRVTWRPTAPLRLAHRRAWGQILAASARMYVERVPLFLSLGVLFVPILAADHAAAGIHPPRDERLRAADRRREQWARCVLRS
jgi:hypothetical protein